MIKIAICDDNEKDVEKLKSELTKFANELNIKMFIKEYITGDELLRVWEQKMEYTDLLYLDIHMPGKDGLTVASELRKRGYKDGIIFYTRSSPEVFRAFDFDAYHYILKDATDEKRGMEIFKMALEKIKKKELDYMSVSYVGETRNIAISEILYFVIDIRVITVKYGKGEQFYFYSSLNKIDQALCDKGFIRINQSTIINVAYVKSNDADNVVMRDGVQFRIGRNRKKDVKETLKKFYNNQVR